MIRTAEEFVTLRRSTDPRFYGRAAGDAAPDPVWLEVIRRHPALRLDVAQNRRVPVSILVVLAGDPDPEVRRAAARHRRMPLAVLERLARDPDARVRFEVAMHRATPPALLEALIADEAPHVVEVARHRLGA